MFKSERKESILERIAAEFFQKETNGRSLVTVTKCRVSTDGRRATIVLSILPKEETFAAYEFAKRRLHDFQEHVRKHARLRAAPFFEIALADEGDK